MTSRLRTVAPALAALLLPLSAATTPMDDPTQQKLEERIDNMQRQLEAMKQELLGLKKANEALATAQQQQAVQQQAATAAPAGGDAPAGAPVAAANRSWGGIPDNLSLWGYGEVYYTNPTHAHADTQFDLARAVFGIGYRFSNRTVFNSEYEVEHAVASADDKGEFEVEQFYIDQQIAGWLSLKAGLFLMPFGLLNERHEPTNFYGVQRNFVETLVIPSTWREGGLGVHGNTQIGLTWDMGLTTGVDLGAWNPNPESPLYRTALELEDNGVAPLQATHQELGLANAHHLSQYVSLNYSGIPGLLAGAALFTGDAAVPTFPAGLPQQRVTLWEAHSRWTPGAAELSALYARGHISNSAVYNLDNAGGANPIPSEFLGYYLQGAYTVWQHDGYRVSPFARWERYDMGAAYQGIPQGFPTVPTGRAADGRPWPQPRDEVWTFGLSFFPDPHVVFKADYQTFHNNVDFTRFSLGLGLNF